jgi:hypothetical protein
LLGAVRGCLRDEIKRSPRFREEPHLASAYPRPFRQADFERWAESLKRLRGYQQRCPMTENARTESLKARCFSQLPWTTLIPLDGLALASRLKTWRRLMREPKD